MSPQVWPKLHVEFHDRAEQMATMIERPAGAIPEQSN
jgi:hypothetical protein